MVLGSLSEGIRERIAASTRGLFAHAPYPLQDSLQYGGDPGLFGPDSATWPVIGDTAAFIGGIRALLVQAAHPEVAAGVFDHSRYREDPLGRLSRTSAYVTATSFGAMPEVERAVKIVRAAHRPVHGVSHRERSYSADAPALAAWVHNALSASFLEAFVRFGPRSSSPGLADRFAAEQVRLGSLLGADPIPPSAESLAQWVAGHPDLGRSPGMADAVRFLRSPPLPWTVRPAYRLLFQAAVATLPLRIRRLLGVRRHPGAILAGRGMTAFLRWALGSSPSWQLALVRVGAELPADRFKQPLPPTVRR
jgi:uncharacterized protein (DUF2236 family)